MILNVSGRTDIVAFYSKWFMNRYKEGFVDVRNPFNRKLVSRINFDYVDLIVFCTKNPKPIIPYLKEIDKPIVFQVTLTPYKSDIEPGVPNKSEVIKCIKEISDILGKDNVAVRYDPILINDKYTIDYHVKAFNKMCSMLEGYVSKLIVSFVDDYKNVRNNRESLKLKEMSVEDYKVIGTQFSECAKKHGMSVQTCFEERNLSEYGFDIGECISHELAFKLTGKTYKNWTARKEKKCNCVQMVDIGVYNSCRHFCKYCYANFDEEKVLDNMKHHNPKSSLLVGELNSDDVIKVRRK